MPNTISNNRDLASLSSEEKFERMHNLKQQILSLMKASMRKSMDTLAAQQLLDSYNELRGTEGAPKLTLEQLVLLDEEQSSK